MLHRHAFSGLAALLLAALTVSSCQDDLLGRRGGNGSAISFVAGVSAPAVRSLAGGRDTLLTVVGRDSLFLGASAFPASSPLWADGGSRAVTGESGITRFLADAYAGDDASVLMSSQAVTVSGGEAEYSPVAYWPADDAVTFLAWSATDATGTVDGVTPVYDPSSGSATFSYTLPAPDAELMRDAESQRDLLYCLLPGLTSDAGDVPVSFSHALSAVTFRVGSVPEGTTVNSVSLVGVRSGGSCRVTAGAARTAYSWQAGSATATYSQTFGTKVGGDLDADFVSDGATFMMVPQDIPADASCVIRFTVGEHDYVFTAPLQAVGYTSWQPDMCYVYSISLREFMQVTVEGEVTGTSRTVQGPLYIQNTGLVTSYVRVAVNGWWQDENRDASGNRIIIMPWYLTDSHTGTVTWGDGWADSWGLNAQGDDGFYYHRRPVGVGEYTDMPFYESYTLTANPPTMDSSLELNVIVQTVPAESVTQCWGVTLDGTLISTVAP